MAANMWKNNLKNVESDNNNIFYETLLDFFLQRNGTYFLNKPRMCNYAQPEYDLLWAETCGCDRVLKISVCVWQLCICIFPYKTQRDKPL